MPYGFDIGELGGGYFGGDTSDPFYGTGGIAGSGAGPEYQTSDLPTDIAVTEPGGSIWSDLGKYFSGSGSSILPGFGSQLADWLGTGYTRPGGTKKGTHTGPPSFARRHRRVNPLNAKALNRSLRRLHGFEKFAKRVLHFTHPHQKVSGFKFKRRRRR